jgi:hypothetical protein
LNDSPVERTHAQPRTHTRQGFLRARHITLEHQIRIIRHIEQGVQCGEAARLEGTSYTQFHMAVKGNDDLRRRLDRARKRIVRTEPVQSPPWKHR